MRVQLTVLGSGTSSGVPIISCRCRVCSSADPRDKRTRPSILLRYNGSVVVIDTGPDFRCQALRENITRLDAVLLTHAHADHILGLDDTRPLSYPDGKIIHIYGNLPALEGLRRIFSYAFDKNVFYASMPLVQDHLITGPLELFGLRFIPIPTWHGKLEVLGFRIGNFAYLTDYNEVPESSLELLRGIDVIFLDALRYTEHPTHMTVTQAVELAKSIQPKKAYLTHISHELGHAETNAYLPLGIELCYDGMNLELEIE